MKSTHLLLVAAALFVSVAAFPQKLRQDGEKSLWILPVESHNYIFRITGTASPTGDAKTIQYQGRELKYRIDDGVQNLHNTIEDKELEKLINHSSKQAAAQKDNPGTIINTQLTKSVTGQAYMLHSLTKPGKKLPESLELSIVAGSKVITVSTPVSDEADLEDAKALLSGLADSFSSESIQSGI